MIRRGSPLVVLALVTLVCALVDEVAAQTVAVAPADPTIAVGQTQQFTATGIDTATAVEGGAFHQCALLQDTTVRCWGLNDYGALGNGTFTILDSPGSSNPTPVAATGITGAVAISGGGYHTCARFPDGTLQCWGRNSGDPDGRGGGQLGDPGTTAFASPTPVPVSGITNAVAVTAGGFHTCALLADGTVRCWGQNDQGQLGNGTVDPPGPSAPPNPASVTVRGITTATAISAGGWHTCALLQNGTVRCWGDNGRGQIGDGTAIPPPFPDGTFARRPTPTPVEVVGITTAVAVESGIFHTCALLQDGRMQCWGWNDFGQLGNQSAINASSTPVTVDGVIPAALAPGAEHTCVLLPDARLQCWGDNNFAQLGNGSPRGIFPTPGAAVTGITTATAATSGAEHSCGLLPGGRVQCWGRGLFGRLGDGRDRSQPGDDAFTPVTVVGLGVTWTSSDTTVATIDEAGLATGRSPGSTTITAASGGRSRSTTLTVVEGSPGTRVTLSVIREGSGSGTVASGDGLINCGGACSASYDSGTQVTLTAAPASGSIFSGWGGCDTVSDTTCRVTMSAARSVTATFTRQRFTLAVTRQGTGSGPVASGDGLINCGGGGTCSASYDSGTQVTLTAAPASGSIFSGWGGCDTVSGTTCRVTMSAARSVTATFTRQRFTLVVAREGAGSGIVTSDDGRINCGGGGACSASYDSGTPVTLRARPGLLSAFSGWSGGGCSRSGPCTVRLEGDTTVTARFRLLGLL